MTTLNIRNIDDVIARGIKRAAQRRNMTLGTYISCLELLRIEVARKAPDLLKANGLELPEDK